MATGFSGGGYQTAFASLSSDATIIDANTSTGFNAIGSVNGTAVCTAAVDMGSSVSITSAAYTIGYTGVPTLAAEYSTNGTSWSSLTISAGTNAGFVLVSGSITGLPVTARYIRLSVSDNAAGTGLNCHASVREITINGAVRSASVSFF